MANEAPSPSPGEHCEEVPDEGLGEAAGHRTRSRPGSSLFEVALVVFLALVIALLLKVYVAEAYEIRGKSMLPNFKEDQRVMVLKVFYDIQRGDVIIFSSSHEGHKDLIKRVVGLPGDLVEVEDGRVFINGEPLQEPYLYEDFRLGPADHKPEKGEWVPLGKYYVLGDNRRDSKDSRIFHAIDASSIKGKVIFRWWPLEEMASF